MPRNAKPYFRKAQKRWVCTIDGQRLTLGKTKAEADAKFRDLIANRQSITSEVSSLYALSQTYLDWVEENRAVNTYDRIRRQLEDFIGHVGRSMKIAALRAHHMTAWSNRDAWNSTTRHGNIAAVQRMLNWAVDEQYIDRSPIARIKKPAPKRRTVVYTPEQWKQIQHHASGPFRDLLNFLWLTGCRPKEVRTAERRHVHNDLLIFPPEESKGEVKSRVIYMTQQVLEIISRQSKTGILFRNSRGRPWTKDALVCQTQRIAKKVGFRVIAYGARHSYATNALIKDVDPITVAHLLGHRDASMVSKVYSHLAGNSQYMREAASRAQ